MIIHLQILLVNDCISTWSTREACAFLLSPGGIMHSAWHMEGVKYLGGVGSGWERRERKEG